MTFLVTSIHCIYFDLSNNKQQIIPKNPIILAARVEKYSYEKFLNKCHTNYDIQKHKDRVKLTKK